MIGKLLGHNKVQTTVGGAAVLPAADRGFESRRLHHRISHGNAFVFLNPKLRAPVLSVEGLYENALVSS